MTTVTDDELTMVRATAASIAGRCRARVSDHDTCWTALHDAGLTELRLADGGRPLGTSAMASAVVEELAGAVCGAPVLGHLLATELIRLARAEVPDEPLTVVVDPRWQAPAGGGVAVDAALAERGVALGGGGEIGLLSLGPVVEGVDPTRPTRASGDDTGRLVATLSADGRTAFDAFARTLVAADALGAAAAVFTAAVAYAKDRVQFGVPVGSFQAVQHLCAQAHVHLEAIRSTLLYATRALDDGDRSALTRTSIVAKAYAGDAAVDVVQIAVQVFGGIAITVEHPAHRHLRRVLVDRDVFGDTDTLADLLLEEIDA